MVKTWIENRPGKNVYAMVRRPGRNGCEQDDCFLTVGRLHAEESMEHVLRAEQYLDGERNKYPNSDLMITRPGQ